MTTKVIDKGWNNFLKRTLACDDKFSKVGYPFGAQPDTSSGGKVATMAEIIDIASIHEFGTKNIPMRPHVRITLDEDKEALQKRIVKEINLILDGLSTPEQSLKRLGEWHASRIKRKIKTGDFTPLAPATIAKKKSSKPLIDSGQMIQSVTHVES